MVVRECRQRDVAALEESVPTGRNRYHEARYRRQSEGTSTFLIAYLNDVPAGCGEILWQGAKESDVRGRFPECPEINGLTVAADHRSQGVGTTIIRAAEELALRRGHHRIGMGVGEDNSRAGALYLRLGYEDTGYRYLDRYHYIDERGTRHEVADRCLFLVKELRDVPRRCHRSRSRRPITAGQPALYRPQAWTAAQRVARAVSRDSSSVRMSRWPSSSVRNHGHATSNATTRPVANSRAQAPRTASADGPFGAG
ncbi:GNAT family N-acetyltransferase [Verrucosispora sp. CWR15]|uniref:GNAT family N-acetyltransferase n=1 Tax=Verrucosispora sioxanthis TaxID=2499994 RepID=A0A6M1L2Z5_9ACTN|nr:GNAT family N-acetyltransferase [Verrucosispora sioxanthis]NGM12937.1 GNAT family N-acetyltransferase [Verrucosispora sioxanthis]